MKKQNSGPKKASWLVNKPDIDWQRYSSPSKYLQSSRWYSKVPE